MKIQRILTVSAASLVALTTVAAGQTQPLPTVTTGQPVERITFQEAVDIALKQNLQVRQAENAVENAQIGVSQSRSSMYPTLNLSGGGSNNIGRSFDLATGTLQTKNTQGASGQLSSSVTLFDAGRPSDIRSARSAEAASSYDLSRTRQTAVYTVAQNFVAYVSAQSRLEVQKENLASQQLQEQQIQRFADAGARPISDLYNIKANVANAQLQVTQAEAQIEAAKFNLMRVLQLDPSKDYDFVAPNMPDPLTTVYNLDSLVKVAYTKRADILSAENRLTSAKANVRGASLGHVPSIGVSASYGSSGRFWTRNAAGDPIPFTNQFDDNRSGSVGFNFSIPIFDRSATRLAKTRAQIEEENSELALANTRQTVALDVRTAWYNVRSSQQQMIAAQAQLTAATQALEATQQRYNVGAATLLDVTQARALRVQAQSALSDARYTLVLNQAAMSYFTGELDPKGILTFGR